MKRRLDVRGQNEIFVLCMHIIKNEDIVTSYKGSDEQGACRKGKKFCESNVSIEM